MRSCSNLAARRARIAALLVAGGLCSQSSLAYRTGGDLSEIESESAVRWPTSVLSFELSSEQLPPELDSDEVAAEAISSLQTWESPGCASLLIDYARTTEDAAELGDGRNTIQFVTEGWADRGYAPDQAGVTELDYARIDDGEWFIAEADLFINAEHFTWSVDHADDARPLRSLFIHEGGHMLGLLHPCEEGADGVPECDEGDFEGSAMYPFYDSTQLSLNQDDEAGICFLYPACSNQSCSGTTACTTDDDCEEGDYCAADGFCAVNLADLGDPCVSGEDCTSAYCSPEAICAVKPGEFGAACSTSTDCTSDQCLIGAADSGICTNLCETDDECPDSFYCTPVEDRRVCATPDVVAKGGCAVSSKSSSSSSSMYWLLGATLSLCFSRLRRRKFLQVHQ